MRTVFDIKIDFKKSQGSFLFDKITNKRYLDLFSMFSSLPLGYNHPVFDSSFDEEIRHPSHLRMSNNLYISEEFLEFEKKFSGISFHKNLHFCSTGALAVESAIKCAYEYSKKPNSIVVSAKNGYHGINSWGFATDRELSSVKSRMEFFPENNWVSLGINEIPEYISKNHRNISAVIIEPIQCTAGDIYLSEEILLEIQSQCHIYDVCFIVDEIQTGFGSTGEVWYSNALNLSPDIIVFGKKAQICGLMASEKYSAAIHSSVRKLQFTFDGDLIDAIRCKYVIKAFEEYSIFDNVNRKSILLEQMLNKNVLNYRQKGFLIAFDFLDRKQRDLFVKESFDRGILLNPTGERSVRVRPNLAFSDDDLDFLDHEISKIFSRVL